MMANCYEPTTLFKRAGVYFIANIRYQMLKKNQNFIAIVVGRSGCLDQETEIKLWKGEKIIYKKLKDCPKLIDVPSYDFKTKTFHKQCANVTPSGIKPCYKISFSDGSDVIASEDHIFFKHKGQPITVKELRDHYWNPRRRGEGQKERILLATKSCLANENGFYGHHHTEEYKLKKHKAEWETGIRAYNRPIILNQLPKQCQVCAKPKQIVHHKDGNRHNNELSNLQTMCYSCHSKLHWGWRKSQTQAKG